MPGTCPWAIRTWYRRYGREIEMEAIEYANAVADLEALSVHYMKHSGVLRQLVRISRICIAGTALSVALVAMKLDLDAEVLVPVMIGAIAGVILYPRLYHRSARAQARRTYSTGKNKTVLGWHRLRLLDDELGEESEGGSRTIRYEAIESVAETESHVFIYVTTVSAHVIPKNAVSAGTLGSFVTSLRERIERADGSSAPGFSA